MNLLQHIVSKVKLGHSFYLSVDISWSKSSIKRLCKPVTTNCFIPYKNQSFNLHCISNDWFLHEMHHWVEMTWVNVVNVITFNNKFIELVSINFVLVSLLVTYRLFLLLPCKNAGRDLFTLLILGFSKSLWNPQSLRSKCFNMIFFDVKAFQ